MTNISKAKWLKAIGYLLSTVPPMLATLEHFPLWLSQGKTTAFSLLGLVLLLLCLIPFRRGFKAWLSTPSAWKMWLLLWAVLYFSQNIFEGLLAVATVALPSSLLGALSFQLAKKVEGNT